MSLLTPAREITAEAAIRDHVLRRIALGIYDPSQPRRERVEVASFTVEILEWDDEESVAHAGGTVVLRGAHGDVEQFLRVSFPLVFEGDASVIPADAPVRAVYIIDLDSPSGACKETAALANV